jgi:signal transduction histidine kinase
VRRDPSSPWPHHSQFFFPRLGVEAPCYEPYVPRRPPTEPKLDRSKAVPIRQFGIHKFAEVIERIRFSNLGDPAVLDLSTIHFIRPSLLVLLRAYIDLLHRGDRRLELAPRQVWALQPSSKQATRYMVAMNLYGAIKPTTDEVDEVQQRLPLQQLHPLSDTDEPAARLKGIILNQLPQEKVTGPLGSALFITLAELLENFARHSESGRVGWVCAQYYRGRTYRETMRVKPRTREDAIEIAIADTGVGIAKSLSAVDEHRRAIADGANPCELAAELGVTGKPGIHTGYGLYIAKRLCERNGGIFKLASGTHWFKSDRGRSECGTLSSPWPGTFVALRLSLQQDLDVNKIYEEMEPLEVMK